MSRMGEAPCGNLITSLLPCFTGFNSTLARRKRLWVADDFVKAGAEALIGLKIVPIISQGGAQCLIRPLYCGFTSLFRKINNGHNEISEEERFPKKELVCLVRDF